MKLQVNIEKKYAFLIVAAVLVLAIVMGVYAAFTSWPATNPAAWHDASSVKVTIGSNAYSVQSVLGGLPTCLSTQALRFTGNDWQCVNLGSVQIAIGIRTDTGTAPIFVTGPSDAILFVTNVNPVSGLTTPGTNLDGMVCNGANGWLLTGCFLTNGGSNEDIWPYSGTFNSVYGCVTDRFDNDGQVDMTIICVK